MCDLHGHAHADLPPLEADDYRLDTPAVRGFIDAVREAIAGAGSARHATELIRPHFAGLMAGDDWLPPEFQDSAPDSGMGGGIGQWLIFRSADRDLSLFSLVVPAGVTTPIHDHLAWGLVGLFRGEQDETSYRALAGQPLATTRRRHLRTGDFYALLPPDEDIHEVTTTSSMTSVSIHLLASDTGCVWRHSFDPGTGTPKPFRSGYVNAPCDEP
jgi:predicted metal-dependent enzyme (double-stranded beta helix superfamily)